MRLLAHRGIWQIVDEQNTLGALGAALERGCGIETDIRDAGGNVVISHDMAKPGHQTLDGLIRQVSTNSIVRNGGGYFALNVKSDGLAQACSSLIGPIRDRCFLFDMSIPDTLHYLHIGLPVFARHSDIEPEPAFYEEVAGIWLDELRSNWIVPSVIKDHLNNNKKVSVVSRELRSREHLELWRMLRPFRGDPRVMLCTDLVTEAAEFFGF